MNPIVQRVKLLLVLGLSLITCGVTLETKAAAAAQQPNIFQRLYKDIWTDGIWKNVTSTARAVTINGGTMAVGAAAYYGSGKLFGFVPTTTVGLGGLAAYYLVKKTPDALGKWAEDYIKKTFEVVGLPLVLWAGYKTYNMGSQAKQAASATQPIIFAAAAQRQQQAAGLASRAGSVMSTAWQKGKWPLAAVALTGATIVALKKYVFDPVANRVQSAGSGRPAGEAAAARR